MCKHVNRHEQQRMVKLVSDYLAAVDDVTVRENLALAQIALLGELGIDPNCYLN